MPRAYIARFKLHPPSPQSLFLPSSVQASASSSSVACSSTGPRQQAFLHFLISFFQFLISSFLVLSLPVLYPVYVPYLGMIYVICHRKNAICFSRLNPCTSACTPFFNERDWRVARGRELLGGSTCHLRRILARV